MAAALPKHPQNERVYVTMATRKHLGGEQGRKWEENCDDDNINQIITTITTTIYTTTNN